MVEYIYFISFKIIKNNQYGFGDTVVYCSSKIKSEEDIKNIKKVIAKKNNNNEDISKIIITNIVFLDKREAIYVQ